MRVNVDSMALRDPRFRRAARRLNVSHHEVLARCISVWMVCYERREAVIAREDIEIAAELDGFTDALVGSDLADLVNDRDVYIRGVTERILFLEKQSERGKRSGNARREMSAELQKRTSVQQTFDLPLNQATLNGRSISRSTGPRTNSPDQAHALDQDLEITNDPKERVRSSDMEGRGSLTESVNVAPAPNGAASGHAKRQPPEPPEQALTLAHLLLGLIATNNPDGRTALMADRMKESTALRWAIAIHKLNRLDGQTWGAIEAMIVWCQRDRFWQTVILGADNLRDKWDKMLAQKQRQPTAPPQKRGPTAIALDELERLENEERERNQNQ